PHRDLRRRGARTGSRIVARRVIGEVAFAVIGLLFLIADIRTFASTFQQSLYGTPSTTLAAMAAAVFATSLLAPLVGWRLGTRGSIDLSGAILGRAALLAPVSGNHRDEPAP